MNAKQQVDKNTWISIFMLSVMLVIPMLSASAAQVNINSVDGWNAGDFVVNGKWTGQPTFSKPPLSNAYKDMLAIESQSSSATFTITGKNFGAKKGSVDFLGADHQRISGVNVTIKSWSDSEIEIVAKGPYSFTFTSPGYVLVMREDEVYQPPMSYEGANLFEVKGFVGVINTRGYGQCTWYVAKKRLDVGKSIPMPGAFSMTDSIKSSYVPQLWDGLRCYVCPYLIPRYSFSP